MPLKVFLFCLISILTIKCSAEQNITISNTIFDGNINDVQWCGKDVYDQTDIIDDDAQVYVKKVLFSKSNTGIVYKSFDNGKQWYLLQSVFEKLVMEKLNEKKEQIKISKIIRSKAENQHIYFLGDNGISFFTNDCGLTFKLIQHDSLIKDIKPSLSKNSSLILIGDMDCSQYPVICKYSNWAYVSLDNGDSIKKIDEMILEIEWAKQDRLFSDSIPEERIILTSIKQQEGKIVQKVQYSDDFTKNMMVVDDTAYRFYLSDQHLYLLCVQDLGQQQFTLKLADLSEFNMVAREVEIPIKRMKDHSFTVLDATQDVIFVNINHLGDNSKFGNVYSSISSAESYQLSLLYNVRSDDGFVDFKRLDSMDGSYIANHYEHSQAEKFKNQLEQITNSQIDNPSSIIKQYSYSLDNFKKSVISFNEGANWQPIKSPEKDMYNQIIECNGECSLHFKGITDQLGNQIYSDINSPGIIIGVGNVGMYLSNDQHEMNTYLSRDGGHTWKEIRKGSYHYSVGDKGGLIVMGKEHGTTDTLIYSWDEGISFNEIKISNYQIQIKDILIEPTEMALNFIVVGSTQIDNTFKNIIIGLDFESLHQRECVGHNKPNTKDSDYELWTPHYTNNQGCIMGRKMTIIRKKQASKCYNPESFLNTQTSNSCACSDIDFQCDLLFMSSNNLCIPANNDVYLQFRPKNCQKFYLAPSGYIKIPGNKCVKGLSKDKKVKVSCNDNQLFVEPKKAKDQGIVDGKIIGQSSDQVKSQDKPSPPKNVKKRRGEVNLQDYEAFGENQFKLQDDMVQYDQHLQDVEKQNQILRDQQIQNQKLQNKIQQDEINSSRQNNFKFILILLMLISIIVFLREHIIQVVIDIKQRLKGSNQKPYFDYNSAGEPTDRFHNLDNQEFKSLSKDNDDEAY